MSNRSGSPYSVPRDANHVPLLVAASTADGVTPVVLEADPTTHLLQVSSSGGGGSGGSTANANVYNNQIKPNTTATALGSTTGLTNGVIIQALAANTGKVYVGNSGVTAANGMELQPGQATSLAVSTLANAYVIATNATDGVAFLGN